MIVFILVLLVGIIVVVVIVGFVFLLEFIIKRKESVLREFGGV